jgi:hypothetical protein
MNILQILHLKHRSWFRGRFGGMKQVKQFKGVERVKFYGESSLFQTKNMEKFPSGLFFSHSHYRFFVL